MKLLTAAAGLFTLAFVIRTAGVGAQSPRLGEPLAGMAPRDFEEFRLGLEDFLEVETSEDGLGPAFNGSSCAVCHNVPVVGGGGVIGEIRAAGRDAAGRPVAAVGVTGPIPRPATGRGRPGPAGTPAGRAVGG